MNELTNECTIERLTHGFVVSISQDEGEYIEERTACPDAYDVLVVVLPWLGINDELAAEILGIYDDEAHTFLPTEKGEAWANTPMNERRKRI